MLGDNVLQLLNFEFLKSRPQCIFPLLEHLEGVELARCSASRLLRLRRVVGFNDGGNPFSELRIVLGLFHDLGSHLLDLLDYLLGPLSNVEGFSYGEPGSERVAMSFTQGVEKNPWVDLADRRPLEERPAPVPIVGTATWNFAASRHSDQITLDGTDGSLSMSCFGNEPLKFRSDPDEPEPLEIECPHEKTVQQYLMTHVLLHLRNPHAGRNEPRTGEPLPPYECPSTGDSALRTNAVIDAVVDA